MKVNREIAGGRGGPGYLIDSVTEIDPAWFQGAQTVLITAGASAPEDVVQDCVAYLRDRFGAEVEERTIREGEAYFRLPRPPPPPAAPGPPRAFANGGGPPVATRAPRPCTKPAPAQGPRYGRSTTGRRPVGPPYPPTTHEARPAPRPTTPAPPTRRSPTATAACVGRHPPAGWGPAPASSGEVTSP